MSTNFCCFVITIIRLIFLESFSRLRATRISLYVGIRASILRKSSTIFGDCSNAFRRLFSIVRELIPNGLFISHRKPFISISGVCTLTRRIGGIKTTSKPSFSAKKSAVIFSCLSGNAPGGTIIVPILRCIIKIQYTRRKLTNYKLCYYSVASPCNRRRKYPSSSLPYSGLSKARSITAFKYFSWSPVSCHTPSIK